MVDCLALKYTSRTNTPIVVFCRSLVAMLQHAVEGPAGDWTVQRPSSISAPDQKQRLRSVLALPNRVVHSATEKADSSLLQLTPKAAPNFRRGCHQNSYYGISAGQLGIAPRRAAREEGKQAPKRWRYGNSTSVGHQHAASTVWLGQLRTATLDRTVRRESLSWNIKAIGRPGQQAMLGPPARAPTTRTHRL